MYRNKRTLHAATLVCLSLAVAACGRGSDDSAAEPGFDEDGKSITVGALQTLTGDASVLGIPIAKGFEAYIKALNARGGVNGEYKVELVTEDTGYDPTVGVQKYQKIKNQVVMFGGVAGSGVLQALLPQLNSDGIITVPASNDAQWKDELYLAPLGASSQIQIVNAANWYVTEGGGSVDDATCAIAVDLPIGDATMTGAEYAVKGWGKELAKEVRFAAADQDFTASVTQLRDAKCETVILSAVSQTPQILAAAKKLGFAPQWLGQSASFSAGFAKSADILPLLTKNFLVAGEGPTWGDESQPGMVEMLEAINRYAPGIEPDQYVKYGYAQGIITEALLSKALEMGDLSREGMADAMKSLGEVDFKGLYGEYTYAAPADRVPSVATSMFQVDGDAPGGLKAVEVNYVSDAAQEYVAQN